MFNIQLSASPLHIHKINYMIVGQLLCYICKYIQIASISSIVYIMKYWYRNRL